MLRRSGLLIARRCGKTNTSVTAAISSRYLSDAAASTAPTQVKLTFGLPHETIYQNASVSSVIVPGLSGEYGVTAGHVPYVAQLKPGVLQIFHDDTSEPEKYFVPGGYAITHIDSSTVRSHFFVLFGFLNCKILTMES
jgi:F-type H+-transporting ATPase subunit delta